MKTVILAALSVFVFALPARAELAFFASGRTLSIKGHRVEGESLVLLLRGGGEVVCERSAIARIAPDEVPYPEPEPVRPPSPATDVPGSSRAAAPAEYAEMIDKAAAEHGVPANLVRALVQVESAYQARARSPKGAMGLMQLMPQTARQYHVADPYDPASNIEAGTRHLKSLLQRLPVTLALAAYNAGEAAVTRFHGIPPYRETQNYVTRIMALAAH